MTLPILFGKRDERTIDCWGYVFQLTNDHLTPEDAHSLRHSYDRLGEECYRVIEGFKTLKNQKSNNHEKGQKDPAENPGGKSNQDLYQLLQRHKSEHPALSELWTQANTVPTWVDWDQIARGQEVFYRYGGATLTGLAYQALLGGMAANRVVEVLARTGGFSVKVARHRLFETTQHILQCTKSLESIQPGGEGFASSIRVRLLHAAVRQRIMKLEQRRPGYYDVEKYGVPINDLDCIGTITAFSATIIWLSLPRQGLFLRQQEIEDYVALWRLIAHYTGTPTAHLRNPESAKRVMESLMMFEMHPSDTSRALANNLLRCLEAQPPAYPSRSFLEVNARWLNGNKLCDALGLGRPSLYYWALMAGQCLFFMVLCYTYRSFETLDRRKIKALRKVMWRVIVEGKHGLGQESIFDFKYIPDYHITTSDAPEVEKVDAGGITKPGVERRNLTVLLFCLGSASFGIYAAMRLASSFL